MDQYIGKMLDGRYEILEVIGTGGMAVVYKAMCHRLNRLVAVKILKDEFSRDAEFRRRFHAESQAVAMLSHPNIVSVYDVSHTEDVDYIVMELIDGITLKQYMEQKGALNWREALHFATQICKALEHAHSRGIIHRDIKPHNIMLLKDGSVKVADFGIARMTSAQATLTREALGSVHYISPEQAKGGKVDCRSDLYSLGVVMYEMLTGRPPFDGDTPVSVAIQHINAKATLPRELNPAIPEGLEQITMRAMEANLTLRYDSATGMLADLEQFRQDPAALFPLPQQAQDAASSAVPPRAQPRPAAPHRTAESKAEKVSEKKKKSRTATIAGIICIGLAVIGILVFLFEFFLGDLFSTAEDVVVPSLVGTSAAIDEAYQQNFEIEISWTFDPDVAAGLVISQDPKEGKTVKKGSKLTLVASNGPESTIMPNLLNYDVKDAQNILADYNVSVTVSYEDSDIYAEDHIIRTDPEYGIQLSKGQKVELIVSQGADNLLIPVPELIGMDVDEAIAEIEKLKLGKGSIKYVESDLPKGTVTFQSIDQGEKVKEGTVINLMASQGGKTEAETPTVKTQPASVTVRKGESATLTVSASVSDGGTLTYAWYVSTTGSASDLQAVTSDSTSGSSYAASTDSAGSRSYCCKVTNTLDGSTASVYTNLAKVTVEDKVDPVTQVLDLKLPDGEGQAQIVVKLDGANYMSPFTVDRSEGTIQIAVESTGTHQVDVYVDGLLKLSKSVTFTS